MKTTIEIDVKDAWAMLEADDELQRKWEAASEALEAEADHGEGVAEVDDYRECLARTYDWLIDEIRAATPDKPEALSCAEGAAEKIREAESTVAAAMVALETARHSREAAEYLEDLLGKG